MLIQPLLRKRVLEERLYILEEGDSQIGRKGLVGVASHHPRPVVLCSSDGIGRSEFSHTCRHYHGHGSSDDQRPQRARRACLCQGNADRGTCTKPGTGQIERQCCQCPEREATGHGSLVARGFKFQVVHTSIDDIILVCHLESTVARDRWVESVAERILDACRSSKRVSQTFYSRCPAIRRRMAAWYGMGEPGCPKGLLCEAATMRTWYCDNRSSPGHRALPNDNPVSRRGQRTPTETKTLRSRWDVVTARAMIGHLPQERPTISVASSGNRVLAWNIPLKESDHLISLNLDCLRYTCDSVK